MENRQLPSDHLQVIFTDNKGISHQGIYSSAIKAFVELVGDEGPEDAGVSYTTDQIVKWEYLEDPHSDDPDTIEIL